LLVDHHASGGHLGSLLSGLGSLATAAADDDADNDANGDED
jgi:hypothetical protein